MVFEKLTRFQHILATITWTNVVKVTCQGGHHREVPMSLILSMFNMHTKSRLKSPLRATAIILNEVHKVKCESEAAELRNLLCGSSRRVWIYR